MANYIDKFLDECFAYGFEGGPVFNTQIVQLQSGREKRNALWSQQKHRYTATFLNITQEAYKQIKNMHLVARGQLYSFKMIDPLDSFSDNQVFGQGNGTQKTFQLSTTSNMGGVSYTRGIYGIVTDDAGELEDSFEITVNNVATSSYTVDPLRGTIEFDTAPANGTILRWSGRFFVWVRFEQDELPFTLDNPNRTNGQVTLYEVAPPPLPTP